MTKGFPPLPRYPKDYDSDYTLFLVHNTAQTTTTADVPAYAEEIPIRPVAADKDEIWADNGYANIDGELFYYDAVHKDENGKVDKLKRCSRNLGGSKTKYTPAGVSVQGFVVAEHHNQLVASVLKMEEFIGENFSTDKTTLDWRIRNLRALPVIFDDFSCPDIVLQFVTLEEDPASGTLVSFNVTIQGNFSSYRLDFGDGGFTTTETTGTYRYARNAEIDPVVTVSNDRCTIVQTAVERISGNEPVTQEAVQPFEIKIPTVPEIPDIVFPGIDIPDVPIQIPPIVLPCLDIGPIGPISIPSVIVIDPPINIPSIISITPIEIPSTITIIGDIPSVISVVDFPSIITIVGDIPSLIEITGPEIPDTIVIEGEIPSTIVIEGELPSIISIVTDVEFPSTITIEGPEIAIPSTIVITPVDIPEIITVVDSIPEIITISGCEIPSTMSIDWGSVPAISVNWGTPPALSVTWGSIPVISFAEPPTISAIQFGTAPTISVDWGTPPTCSFTVTCPTGGGGAFAMRSANTQLGDDFTDDFDLNEAIHVEATGLGIPSEINLIVPHIPDIRVQHDLPSVIELRGFDIPKEINVTSDIPKEIRVLHDIPTEIKLLSPTEIELIAPKSIELDTSSLPRSILLEPSADFPLSIRLDASGVPDSISVIGIPETIELRHNIPTKIDLALPEKPEIDLVYRGAPIDVQIKLDTSKLTGENGEQQCFALVPCK